MAKASTRPPTALPEPEPFTPPAAPAPVPAPEVKTATGYQIDRTKTKAADRIREVIAEFKDAAKPLVIGEIKERLASFWPDVDWTTKSNHNAATKLMNNAGGTATKKTVKVVKTRTPRIPKVPADFVPPLPVAAKPQGYGAGLDLVGILSGVRDLAAVYGPDTAAKMVLHALGK